MAARGGPAAGRGGLRFLLGLAALYGLAQVNLACGGLIPGTSTTPGVTAGGSVRVPRVFFDQAPALAPARPERVLIPAIGVDAPLTGLGISADGTLQTLPSDRAELAGWWEGGPAPGAKGSAVIAGHVDTDSGRGVFHGLANLTRGQTVRVRRVDGRTAVFTVDAVTVHDRDKLPEDELYGRTRGAELRLITCAGRYDPKTGYSSNIVVHAHLTGTEGGGGGGSGAGGRS
ncbi:class F sortase (plasmid) [Streptomyces sp. BI20]|uniref:class F sortase n=1 Tax=Streptomyces sp. BI20 TaxID=3403460 RepID=UPI003C7127A5